MDFEPAGVGSELLTHEAGIVTLGIRQILYHGDRPARCTRLLPEAKWVRFPPVVPNLVEAATLRRTK